MRSLYITFCIVFLSACGGGSSSGESARNVTNCVQLVTGNVDANGIAETIYTNTCGFDVNLSLSFGTIIRSPVLIQANGSYDDLLPPESFIACRPPSVGISANKAGDAIKFVCN